MSPDTIAKGIRINGIVQGVGFRPFVYQLAHRHRIRGHVANTAAGVLIHAEGPSKSIHAFCRDLSQKKPPLARIIDMDVSAAQLENHADFTILASDRGEHRSTLISPDVSICNDCLKELLDPKDRRYRYPFINCTNCGPRYTIIEEIPYDRPHTAMKGFPMCFDCQAEYDEPLNRRFHAQPNACHVCGPQVALYDRNGKRIAAPDPILETVNLLESGNILAIKGLGGFHLAADAMNDEAVALLRSRKHREEKPFALMSPDLGAIGNYAHYGSEEADLLSSAHRPIVLLRKREPNEISAAVSPENRCFGVMLPYTPLHYLLFYPCAEDMSFPPSFPALVMTSGNLSNEPIAIENEEAFSCLSGIADAFLMHNRDIYLRSDDSIIRQVARSSRPIRRSRGYVPVPIFLGKKIPPVLGCGGELKNTICITKGENAFLSQHIGDLENLSAERFYKKTIDHMKRILDIEPSIIAHDLHPDYISTRYAMEQKAERKIGIQHHHAHIASVMAENRIDGPVIGLAFDGTGYGTDRAIWGGEVLLAELSGFTRAAHLGYVPMPGGAAAIKEPWRMGIGYLYDAYGEKLLDLDLPILRNTDKSKISFVTRMIVKGINSPATSSLGRLFDGIAAILGLRNRVTFEGQAAMDMEMIAEMEGESRYLYEWDNCDDTRRICTAPLISGVVNDLHYGLTPSEISGKFHRTLIGLFTELALEIRKETGLNRAALSGGVFQNSILLSGMIWELEREGFKVYTHTQVPTNDGGISLGQVAAAGAMIEKI